VPDDVTALLYVDVQKAAALAMASEGLREGAAAPQVAENLKPLQSLVLYSTVDGDRTNVSGFLAIK
jgi:hypothetical protein